MRISRSQRALLVAAALLVGCGGTKDGPTAPAGTNLSGHWGTGPITYTGSGNSISRNYHFWVNATSTAIDSMYLGTDLLCTDFGFFAQYAPCGVAITDGRFRYEDLGLDGSSTLRISGAFRSQGLADGKWSDHNRGPQGFFFTGDLNVNWTATR